MYSVFYTYIHVYYHVYVLYHAMFEVKKIGRRGESTRNNKVVYVLYSLVC